MSKEKNLYPQLNEGLRKNDSETFGQVYIIVRHDLRRYIYNNYDLTVEQASEITQEAFAKLWEVYDKKRTFQTVSDLKAYLWVTAKNLAIDLYKEENKKAGFHKEYEKKLLREPRTMAMDVDNMLRKNIQHEKEIINRIMDMKSERCKEVLLLWYVDGLSMKEIAKKLQIDINNVRNQMTIGFKKITPYLRKDHVLQYALYILVAGHLITAITQIIIVP